MANTRVTEKITCDIKTVDCQNPIALYWVNSLRGIGNWVFEGNRRIDDIDSNHRTFGKAYQDLENTRYIIGTSGKDREQRIIIQAPHLTTQQYNGVIGIISSPKILMLTNASTWESEGAKFIEVFVIQGTHSTEQVASLKTLTLTISLQPILTVKR